MLRACVRACMHALLCVCVHVSVSPSMCVPSCSPHCWYTQAIHEKIQSLDLTDCRARIKQVDSHATLGNGIVIQVRGGRGGGGGSEHSLNVAAAHLNLLCYTH